MIASSLVRMFVAYANVVVAAVAFTFGPAARLAWADFDIRPYASGGKILTDGFDDGTLATQVNDRVFGYAFGEEATDPFFTEDPGFNAVVGSGLQAGPFFFQVLGPSNGSVIPYALSYWDGSGSVTWTAVPNAESLNWNVNSKNVYVNSTGAYSNLAQTIPSSGFSIADVEAAGNIHQHLSAFLLGSDQNAVPAGPGAWGAGDGIEATPGVYALAIVLANGSLANSEPIWIVYNNGLDDSVGDAAIDWLNAHAVPEPASGALAITGLAVGMVHVVRLRGRPSRFCDGSARFHLQPGFALESPTRCRAMQTATFQVILQRFRNFQAGWSGISID